MKKVNTERDYINVSQLCEIIFFMIKKEINGPLNVGSGKSINLINLTKILARIYTRKNVLIFEKKKISWFYCEYKSFKKIRL